MEHQKGERRRDRALVLAAPCEDCGAAEVSLHLGNRALCDRCFDRRIATATGLPELPEPPAPDMRTGPDGRVHCFRYRLWRGPGGIVAEAVEQGPPGGGYHAQVVGSHDAEVVDLLRDLETRLARQVGRLDLERHPGHDGWTMSGFDLRGDSNGLKTLRVRTTSSSTVGVSAGTSSAGSWSRSRAGSSA